MSFENGDLLLVEKPAHNTFPVSPPITDTLSKLTHVTSHPFAFKPFLDIDLIIVPLNSPCPKLSFDIYTSNAFCMKNGMTDLLDNSSEQALLAGNWSETSLLEYIY